MSDQHIGPSESSNASLIKINRLKSNDEYSDDKFTKRAKSTERSVHKRTKRLKDPIKSAALDLKVLFDTYFKKPSKKELTQMFTSKQTLPPIF